MKIPIVTLILTMTIHHLQLKSAVDFDGCFGFSRWRMFCLLGYCFAKCQQSLGACLLARIKDGSDGSLDFCQSQTDQCQEHCLNDKRTGRIAEANWAQVVEILHRYKMPSDTDK